MTYWVRLDPSDNVVTATQSLEVGTDIEGQTTNQLIPSGHKIATEAIPEGAAIRIKITPPWWRTWWFHAMEAALALALLLFFDRVQRSRVRSREALRWAADVERQIIEVGE